MTGVGHSSLLRHMNQTVSTNSGPAGGSLISVLAGGFAGGVTRMVVAPLDVIKIRLQVQAGPSIEGSGAMYRYTGMVDAIKTILQQEGSRVCLSSILCVASVALLTHLVSTTQALWNGNLLAELLSVTFTSLQFGLYILFDEAIMSQIPNSSKASSQSLVSFISGGAAAFVSASVTYPLDLLRTRFAAQAYPKTYTSIHDAIRIIFLNSGVRGFYCGWSPTCVSLVPSMGIQFALYELFKQVWLKDLTYPGVKNSGVTYAAAGALSGMIAKISVLPIDIIKKRAQIQTIYQHRSAAQSNHAPFPPQFTLTGLIKFTYEHEGVAGFFRGAKVSTLKAGISASLTFTLYEYSKVWLSSHK